MFVRCPGCQAEYDDQFGAIPDCAKQVFETKSFLGPYEDMEPQRPLKLGERIESGDTLVCGATVSLDDGAVRDQYQNIIKKRKAPLAEQPMTEPDGLPDPIFEEKGKNHQSPG